MTALFKYKVDHILFWSLTVGFHASTSWHFIEDHSVRVFFGEVIIRNTLLAVVVYSNLYYTIRLLENRKVTAATFTLVGSLVVYSIAKNSYDSLVHDRGVLDIDYLFYNLSIAAFYLGFSLALHFTKQWYLQRQLLRKIELEKLNTELEYLKSQINPHFLFNSINTIYFQIDKQNTEARETLSRFSEMLRYQLYECNGREIPIEREVSYLKNYIELQRLRKDENYLIEYNFSDTLRHFAIPPLLLIPLVENAFKHVSHFSTKPNKINIDLDFEDDHFHLKVFNTKDIQAGRDENGIGLRNVKRRLELLYPETHTLDVTETADTFEVNVSFNVNSNHKD